jgi:molybdopterin-guanine dinucleotide biosynthesis protein A
LQDEIKDKGPLAGIFTGLKNSKKDFNFFISCDLPFITAELLLCMMNEIKNDDIILVPKHENEFEPLCGIYHKQIIDVVYDSLMKNELVLHDLLEKLQASFVVVDNKDFYNKNMFWNINTPEELKVAREVHNG